MDDDLAFLTARLPEYEPYGDETARHDVDMRVRAFVGERLTAALARLAGTLDAATQAEAEALVLRCQFSDQAFVKRLEHAKLDAAAVAALVATDRAIVELALRLADVPAADFGPLITAIEARFAGRSAPLLALGNAS